VCELFCLSSRLPTRATFSLRTFAQHDVLGGSVDGWGLLFHDGRDVRLYKEPEPAGDSPWLAFIQQRRLPSRLVMSHIRHATQGGISLAKTQPFVRELGGRTHVFAHNGRLDGIERRHAGECRRFRPVGDTDSEFALCILLERLSPSWANGEVPSVDDRVAVFAQFAADMRDLGPANFLYSDGDVLFVHGHRRLQRDGTIAPPGLWLLSRRCGLDTDALSQAGILIDADPQAVVLFASVPLTDEPWYPLNEGQIIAVKDSRLLTPLSDHWPRGDIKAARKPDCARAPAGTSTQAI
jgi:predicted glutamine amidotransferase